MLSEFAGTQIKLSGINVVRVVKGCFGVNITIEVSFCTYWGAIPDSKLQLTFKKIHN